MTQAESLKTRSRKGRRSQGGSGAHEEETLPTLKAMFESQKAEEEEMHRLAEEARLKEEERNRQIEEEEATKAAAKLKKKKEEKAKIGQQPKEGTYSTKLKRKLKPRQLCANSKCWMPASLLKLDSTSPAAVPAAAPAKNDEESGDDLEAVAEKVDIDEKVKESWEQSGAEEGDVKESWDQSSDEENKSKAPSKSTLAKNALAKTAPAQGTPAKTAAGKAAPGKAAAGKKNAPANKGKQAK
ncbi:MAG: hypothetical protein J3Q66DRAFT_442796 [Benniella sp.]|nr:MAG: hypothetical protein J3Q66DRAFT_442796 [Benniella sp.]